MDGGGGDEISDGAVFVREGPFSGWMTWPDSDPFETLAGPYYFRKQADGTTECAMEVEHKNLNGHGFAHGGALMSFADFCLFALSRAHIVGTPAVTVSMNSEFLGTAMPGDTVICRGEVTRGGGNLVFARGLLLVKEKPIFTFSGVIKRLKPRPKP